MKDRVRQAVFNLVRDCTQGLQAIDLFAGTGALGLEAISRGARRALLIEQHHPTATIIRENIRTLGLEEQARVLTGDAFAWAANPRYLGTEPWLIFCSPPFDFYCDRHEQMIATLWNLIDRAPQESAMVVEADSRFDFAALPDKDRWDIRDYPPAVVGVYRMNGPAERIDPSVTRDQ